jgi:hypothetical protein
MTARGKPPKWSDESAVAKRVAEEIKEAELEEERLWYTHYLPEIEKAYATGRIPPVRLLHDWNKPHAPAPKPTAKERAAIEAVLKSGDVEILADLIRPESLGSELLAVNPAVEQGLSLATWYLLTQLVTGELDLRKIRGRGRPKLTADDRRAASPVHDAADVFSEIKDILTCLYPEQDHRQLRDRAIAIAAQHKGVAPSTLAKYLGRPKKDRRRLTS